MRANDPSTCEDMLGMIECFRESLTDCPDLALFMRFPENTQHDDGQPSDCIQVTGYWPPHRQYLSLSEKEAQQFFEWLTDQNISNDVVDRCRSKIIILSQDCNVNDTFLDCPIAIQHESRSREGQ